MFWPPPRYTVPLAWTARVEAVQTTCGNLQHTQRINIGPETKIVFAVIRAAAAAASVRYESSMLDHGPIACACHFFLECHRSAHVSIDWLEATLDDSPFSCSRAQVRSRHL